MTTEQHPATTAGSAQAHDAAEVIRKASLRVTKPRLAVLAAVEEHPHASTEVIISAAREELPDVSHQAVYDTLHTLTAAGILRRIQPSGTVARYETRVGDNHHHLVCRACHSIVDVDCVVGEATCLTPSHDHAFRIDEAEITFWGLCPSCAAELAAADDPEAGDTDAGDTDGDDTDANADAVTDAAPDADADASGPPTTDEPPPDGDTTASPA